MNIGAAAASSGVSAKMIRYYERIGLMAPTPRRSNFYRDYGEPEIHELRFIGRARSLGFSTPEIGALVSLWRDPRRSSREVRHIAAEHLAMLEKRAAEIESMAHALRGLVGACHGDDRPQCPILEDLSTARPRRLASTLKSERSSLRRSGRPPSNSMRKD
jgi:MerR family transcriptional regulator, copper efflux regulator